MSVYHIDQFVDVLDPNKEMLGPIASGSEICAVVPPGCWGPMITPSIKSGHEVTRPVAVENADVGDAIAISIKKISILSDYSSSGTCKKIDGRFITDPTVNAVCPKCKAINPRTYVEGVGENAIRCENCGESVLPQSIENGYTLVFDGQRRIGVSIPQDVANGIAALAPEELLPKGSRQHPATVLAKADILNMVTRVRCMVGNIGSMPLKAVPSSRNSGDLIQAINCSGDFGTITKDDLTDAHMDINTVGQGSIVIVPVKVKGGGIFFGDVHSIQGNGELAGHTADVTAQVTVRVNLLKGLKIDGPIIIPTTEMMAYHFRPITDAENEIIGRLASKYGFNVGEKSFPVQFVGTGEDLNNAIENALDRAESITGLIRSELKNRATVAGSVDIGRVSGVVYISMMLPESVLKRMKISDYIVPV